jgi:DNA-binding GntR family transcriptional regulator
MDDREMRSLTLPITARQMTAQQLVYIHLQDQIVSGTMPGGMRLKSDVIAADLGVSRMPVREAVRQLDAEGYVTIHPNRGAFVTSRSRDQIIELFEIRSSLEGMALRLAARNRDDSSIADLHLELQRLRNVENDKMEWVVRHDEFHHHLCSLSGRPVLASECRRYRLAIGPYVRLFLSRNDYAEQPGYGHEILIHAIKDRDAERSEILMRSHIMANAQAIAETLPAPASTSS